ncbi:ScyD/ScyE family protein [Iningainema tapete]|uniref:ScyD/ScyE family protein n=1 Tax=Iningainema tapete BLCC-T55 TaxID=2748662 RepID=A0A8J6XZQ2_9CYAN|nr:ScyD/ScyE family protein [Iningainema tapete]MBD2776263.1 ScyD/ScyE family protein [Iningainema tapete BLCC-T55]
MKFKSFAFKFLAVCIAIAVPKAALAATLTTVASGLNNPRGIGFGSDGSLYVAESGGGGDGSDGRCIPSPSSQYIPLCAASVGAITKITTDGQKQRVVDNLPSIGLRPAGEQGAGPADIKFDDKGNAYLLIGFAGDPNNRDTVLKEPGMGQLYKVDLNTGSLTTLADFAAYEAKNNVDGTDLTSNPYAFRIQGDTAYVIDAGANTISSVDLNGGGIKNVSAFPLNPLSPNAELPNLDSLGDIVFEPSQQSVPAAIAFAPDGTLTVGEYTAFPYPVAVARLFSVDPNTLQPQVIADGFTEVTGVAYDPDGNLYVLQHMNQQEWKATEQGTGNIIGDISGSIIKVSQDGTRETIWSGNGLEAASELIFGPDGNLYTSNRSRYSDSGAILKLDLKGGTTKVPESTPVISLLALGALCAASQLKRRRQEELWEPASVQTL